MTVAKLKSGTEVHHLPTVDSTNSEARRRLDFGEPAPFWIVSDEQTQGRGRLGRQWISTPGNLYSTHAFPFTSPTATASQISFVAALAIHDTASNFVNNADISLKWPNDCLIDGAKFSGILAELHENTMILGMGLNVRHEPQDLPYKATCLMAHATEITVAQVFGTLRLKLKKWLQIWDNSSGFQHIHRGWEARCSAIGKPMSLDLGHTMLHGTFVGLAPDGGLVLNHNNTTTIHHAGDVRIINMEVTHNI
jgi:BirA family transcriptional regulator, biotin operon repressor / biotin---[acetyl-CoA-carboxylase] ligase